MKKGIFVAVIVAILVLALGATAYGAIWNFEKSYRWGTSSYRLYPRAHQAGFAGRGYMYVNGSGTRQSAFTTGSIDSSVSIVYMQWWAVNPNDSRQPTGTTIVKPTANTAGIHGEYLTGTIKCAICHSVHTASPGKVGTTVVADTLLRVKAIDGCGYCHVAAGSAVSDPVYGGTYPIPSEAGHALGGPCRECHTGPHGSLAETAVASVRGKLLTLATDYGATEGVWEGNPAPQPWSTILTRVNAMDTSAAAQGYTGNVTGFSVAQYQTLVNEDIKNQAVGVFCGGCHEGSYANTIAGASASNYMGWRSGEFSGHRTLASATTTWNAFGAKISSAEASDTQIANSPASSCYSCHDASNGFSATVKAFPHNWGTIPGTLINYDAGTNKFTNQTFAWLLKATSSERSDLATSGGVTGKSAHVGANGGTLSDGVCLKCHRWGGAGSAATSGVGLTF